jgi:hypothetical protein
LRFVQRTTALGDPHRRTIVAMLALEAVLRERWSPSEEA